MAIDAAVFSTAPASSLKAFYRLIGNSPEAETHILDGFFYWHTQIAHPWFNGALVSRAPSSDESGIIAHTRNFFADRNVNSHTVWLEDDLQVEAWAAHLKPAGYTVNLGPPGMSADLKDLPDSVPVPEGFSIRPVEDHALMKTWSVLFARGYGLPGSFAEPYGALMASFGFDRQVRSYLGYLDGVPVTASSLFLDDGTAGIYNVATLPESRGRGLGAAITLAPLLEARQMGVEIGTLQSSEMGFRVYQRLGFRKVCDVVHFGS